MAEGGDGMTTITEAGLVPGMPDEIYHSDPVPERSLSSTFARLLTDHVPAKAKALRENRVPSRAMNLGKAAHRYALGAGPELIIWQHDGRTKDGKAERAERAEDIAAERAVAVTAAERDQIIGMADALWLEPEVRRIFERSQAEVSGFAQQDGIWLRARYDLLSDVDAHDYKTTADVTRRGFQKALGNWGYHQQADFYQRVLKILGHAAGRRPMRFICQETTAPYLVQIHTPDAEAMDIARELNDRAIRLFAECTATGVWPGYLQLVAEPTPLPAYYFNDHEDVLTGPSDVEVKVS